MTKTIDRAAIRASIPEECALTLDHADVHLNSARAAAACGDDEQAAHDADLAARILLCVGWLHESRVTGCALGK